MAYIKIADRTPEEAKKERKRWREYYRKNREERRAYAKKYYEEHREHLNELSKQYYQNIKETDRYKARRYKDRQKYYDKTANAPNRYTRWTLSDEMLVYEHQYTDAELSEMLGRSVKAIQMKRNKLTRKLSHTE